MTLLTRRRLLHPRSVLLVALGCFLALALGAAFTGVFTLDTTVRDALLSVASPAVVRAMRVANAAGDWRVLLPGTALLFVVFPEARARWWLWLGLMVLGAAAPDLVKVVVARARPEDLSFGFPSGHSTAAAAYFGAVIYLAATLRPPARVLVRAAAAAAMLLVATARIVLRAHWPSDTMGGIAFGLALASVAALVAATPASADAALTGGPDTPPPPRR